MNVALVERKKNDSEKLKEERKKEELIKRKNEQLEREKQIEIKLENEKINKMMRANKTFSDISSVKKESCVVCH